MLISAAIGLIISTAFFNIGFSALNKLLIFNQGQPTKIGKVFGVGEDDGTEKILIKQNHDLNKAVVKAIEGVKSLPIPRLFQLPQLDQPMRRFENSRADRSVKLARDGPLRPQSEASEASESRPTSGQEPTTIDFNLSAENGAILDFKSDSLFFAKRPDRSWSIASITKLFTAYTFLDYNPGWETVYEIKLSDRREGGKIYLFTGDRVTVKDLFYFSLVGSDNTATAALVEATGLSETEFVEKMNAKAKELGLKNTRLLDPAGLKDGNISTAREVALFAKIALANEEISRASLTKKYEFNTKQGRRKAVANTNELLYGFPDGDIRILGGKTGHVDSSGYCLVEKFKNQAGREIITVVLGADSDSSRFNLTKNLVNLYYKNQP